MKFGVLNKSTTVNRFVLHTLQRNITHLAVITRKTNKKLGILKGGGGGLEKSPLFLNSRRLWQGFVLFVTLLREAADDIRRWVRDKDINNALYLKVTQSHTGYSQVKCKDIKVSAKGRILLFLSHVKSEQRNIQ